MRVTVLIAFSLLVCAHARFCGGCVASATADAQPTAARFEFARLAMGTKARLVLYGHDEAVAREAASAAFAEIERIEQALSDYRLSSEIRRFQDGSAVSEWVAVSPTLFESLMLGQRICERTDGAFSITAGPTITLWRAARRAGVMPSIDEVARARLASDPAGLSLDPESRRARMNRGGMAFDFGGIGKGYAADVARGVLIRSGYASCMVDLGGDLALGAPPPGKAGWRVSISIGDGEVEERTLASVCVATSGDAEQFFEADGMRYSHIVDPRSGWPLTDGQAATVIHPEGAIADALASAACVLGCGPRSGDAPDLSRRFPDAVILCWTRGFGAP